MNKENPGCLIPGFMTGGHSYEQKGMLYSLYHASRYIPLFNVALIKACAC